MRIKLLLLLVVLLCSVQLAYSQKALWDSIAIIRSDYKAKIEKVKAIKKSLNIKYDYWGVPITSYVHQLDFINHGVSSLEAERDTRVREVELNGLLTENLQFRVTTLSNFNQHLKTQFRTLSGTEVKNGKFMGTSAAVDAKSVTVNFAIKPSRYDFYIMPTVSGSSKDGFVDVFTGSKYKRTITGGVNFILLTNWNSGWDSKPAANNVHVELQRALYEYNQNSSRKDSLFYINTIKGVMKSLSRSGNFIQDLKTANYIRPKELVDPTNVLWRYKQPTDTLFKDLDQYSKGIDTLIGAKLLPKQFKTYDLKLQYSILSGSPENGIHNVIKNKLFDQLDKTQQAVSYGGQKIYWVGAGIKYNQANYNIADGSSKTLIRNFADEYLSANFSITYLKTRSSGNKFYISPTLNYQNNHNFKSGDEIKAQTFSDYPIGSVTTQKIEKELSFYEMVPNRLHNIFLEIPMAYFWTKTKLGIEVAIRGGLNDVENDNLGGRVGLLIPVSSGGSNTIVVEPLVKVGTLNEKVAHFWKDNFGFGVSVSVTIPKAFFQ